jgi:hypothetical protein
LCHLVKRLPLAKWGYYRAAPQRQNLTAPLPESYQPATRLSNVRPDQMADWLPQTRPAALDISSIFRTRAWAGANRCCATC